MKGFGVLALISLVIAAHGKQVSPKVPRVAEIWKAADVRMNNQADIWFDRGDFPRALQVLKFRYAARPNDHELATTLGWMLENVKRDDEAVALYVRLRNKSAKEPDLAFPEANYYFRKKLYAKIPQILEPTLSQNPHQNSYRILARSYEKLGQYADAIRVLQMLLKRFPDDLTAKANLERVTKALGGQAKVRRVIT